MPKLTLSIVTKKNTRQLLTVQDLKLNYLFGIKIEKDGHPLPDSVYEYWIEASKVELETYLSIKFDMQIIEENKDFYHDDWVQWSMIKASYPVVYPLKLDGYIGTVKQLNFPRVWLSARKTNDNHYGRILYVVPNQQATYNQAAAIYTGTLPSLGYFGGRQTPNYWDLRYITGFIALPLDIEKAIGMLAAINILTVGNETLASAMGALGTSSKSISLDGLSQSVSMYVNGQTGIFGARIKQYTDMLMGVGGQDGLMKKLQDNYGAFIWGVA